MQINQQQEIKNKATSPQSEKIFLASKKEYEIIFKIMYMGASIFSAVLLHKVYLFQTMSEFDSVREGSPIDLFYFSLPFGIVFTLFDLALHYFFDEPCAKYYLNEEKYQGKNKERRAYTIVKWSYSVIYYAVTSVVSLYLIKDTSFFPTWLGGSGSCKNLIAGAPALSEATFGMKLFYLFQFGKHFSRLFSHMFIRQQGNYYEYVLHHALSTFLILFSYLTNQWLVGIMVLFCHDVSDLFLIMARGYKVLLFLFQDYKRYSKVLLKVIYMFAIVGWVGGRLIIFPACCVYASLVGPDLVKENLNEVEQNVLLLPYRWMGFMLVGLQILHIFWTYYIGKAFVEVSVSSKLAENNYE